MGALGLGMRLHLSQDQAILISSLYKGRSVQSVACRGAVDYDGWCCLFVAYRCHASAHSHIPRIGLQDGCSLQPSKHSSKVSPCQCRTMYCFVTVHSVYL